ncbi:PfkB family carbohydrate kinase [Mediterraneibacter faecis]|nr:PfkB family carbohydrate kinase [Mediterraneibacter faecis]
MGAGDSYIAGFLTGIVDGLSIEGAMEKGAANATETLKYFGAW